MTPCSVANMCYKDIKEIIIRRIDSRFVESEKTTILISIEKLNYNEKDYNQSDKPNFFD